MPLSLSYAHTLTSRVYSTLLHKRAIVMSSGTDIDQVQLSEPMQSSQAFANSLLLCTPIRHN